MPPNATSSTEHALTEAFPGLRFEKPVAVAAAPGTTNRLYVIERPGRIVVITNLAVPNKTIFLDISSRVNSSYEAEGAEGLTAVAFHPNFWRNGRFFVLYSTRTENGNENRLSRFQGSSSGVADPGSEAVLISQPDAGYGHNFNDMFFGPDGYLYVAAGDEGDDNGIADWHQNSQRIDKDFFSAVLRIDVDSKPESLAPNPHPASKGNYRIPPDNPYVGATSFNGSGVDPGRVRTEFYAVGFRNPWRMTLDRETGRIYTGDVGWHGAEEINLVVKGGNYGWVYREGIQTRTNAPSGTSFIDPLVHYQHAYGEPMKGTTIIGGEVYRGNQLPGLVGAYIFADYTAGNIWAMRHEGSAVTEFRRISSRPGLSGFGADPRDRELLLADHTAGILWKLVRKQGSGETIPAKLSETGLFADVSKLTPAPGLVPYEVNVPFWSDGALKRRWFALPDLESKILFNRATNWVFPSRMLWIKHFDLEMVKGDPGSSRRIETRVLVRTDNGVYGVTYRWGGSNDDATLVPEGGMEETFQVRENGTLRSQVWRYPSQAECLSCHTTSGGLALGFNTPQLNRDFNYGGLSTNQIAALSSAGYFSNAVENPHTLRRLAGLNDTNWSREYRVRSYLAANCAQCHNPKELERAKWDARIFTPLSKANIVNGTLVDPRGEPANRVVAPVDPQHSILLQRMEEQGLGRMPPVGRGVVDQEAVDLIREWIAEDLKGYQSFAQWQAAHFGNATQSEAAPKADPDSDGASNELEYLLGTNPRQSGFVHRMEMSRNAGLGRVTFPRVKNRGFELEFATNPMDPESWRPLNLPGNQPFFSATDQPGALAIPINHWDNRFYRLRVYEP